MNSKKDITAYIINESQSTPQVPVILNDAIKDGFARIKTILQDANKENRNKRVYTKDAIQSGLSSEYVKERIETRMWVGEAGHPRENTVSRQMNIDHNNISHTIDDYMWERDDLYGIVETAPGEMGEMMAGFINRNRKIGFSMRGMGSVSEQRGNTTYVRAPLHILTYDWVNLRFGKLFHK